MGQRHGHCRRHRRINWRSQKWQRYDGCADRVTKQGKLRNAWMKGQLKWGKSRKESLVQAYLFLPYHHASSSCRCRLLSEGWLSWSSMAPDLEQVSRGLRIAFPSILWCLSSTPFLAFLCFFPLQWTLQQQLVDVVTYVWSCDQSR